MVEIKSESVADFIPEWVADFPRNTHATGGQAHVALIGRTFLQYFTMACPDRGCEFDCALGQHFCDVQRSVVRGPSI
jgi:hypothetical protein